MKRKAILWFMVQGTIAQSAFGQSLDQIEWQQSFGGTGWDRSAASDRRPMAAK
jgi:hypothetical protein